MQLYASVTGTHRNLDALWRHGFRLLATPANARHLRTALKRHAFRYALDNGAWGAYQSGERWDPIAYMRFAREFRAHADWCLLPDVVGDRESTLELAEAWSHVYPEARWYLCLQDGMTLSDAEPFAGRIAGVFLGGTTRMKLEQMGAWGRWAAERGLAYHVGRVNSRKRLAQAMACGADSIDGTSATVYSVNAAKLAAWARQRALQLYH